MVSGEETGEGVRDVAVMCRACGFCQPCLLRRLIPLDTGRCTTWTLYQKLARTMSVVIHVLVVSDSFQLKVSEEVLRKVCRRNKGL